MKSKRIRSIVLALLTTVAILSGCAAAASPATKIVMEESAVSATPLMPTAETLMKKLEGEASSLKLAASFHIGLEYDLAAYYDNDDLAFFGIEKTQVPFTLETDLSIQVDEDTAYISGPVSMSMDGFDSSLGTVRVYQVCEADGSVTEYNYDINNEAWIRTNQVDPTMSSLYDLSLAELFSDYAFEEEPETGADEDTWAGNAEEEKTVETEENNEESLKTMNDLSSGSEQPDISGYEDCYHIIAALTPEAMELIYSVLDVLDISQSSINAETCNAHLYFAKKNEQLVAVEVLINTPYVVTPDMTTSYILCSVTDFERSYTDISVPEEVLGAATNYHDLYEANYAPDFAYTIYSMELTWKDNSSYDFYYYTDEEGDAWFVGDYPEGLDSTGWEVDFEAAQLLNRSIGLHYDIIYSLVEQYEPIISRENNRPEFEVSAFVESGVDYAYDIYSVSFTWTDDMRYTCNYLLAENGTGWFFGETPEDLNDRWIVLPAEGTLFNMKTEEKVEAEFEIQITGRPDAAIEYAEE